MKNLTIINPQFNSKHQKNSEITAEIKVSDNVAFIETIIDSRWNLGLNKPENNLIKKNIKLNTGGRRILTIKAFNPSAELIDFTDLHLDIIENEEKGLINKILELAQSQIGYTENPPNSNHTKFNEWYYGKPVSAPWCAIFVSWLFAQNGKVLPWQNERGFAYCPYGVKRAKELKIWFGNPRIGDLIFFDWGGDGIADHIGIVEKVNADGSITTIEGNTSTTNKSNGGQVMRRTRYKNQIMGYARIII